MIYAAFHEIHHKVLAAITDGEAVAKLVSHSDASDSMDQGWERLWGRIEQNDPAHIRILVRSVADPSDMRVVDMYPTDMRSTNTDSINTDSINTDSINTDSINMARGCLSLDAGFGRVEVAKFPDDPMLPTLPAALAANPGSEIVRYRPGRRCTIRTKLNQFVKVFPDDRAKRLHDEAAQVFAASAEGQLDFEVAAPLWFAPNMSAFAQATVPGIGISEELFGPDGSNLAWRVGAASASLPTSGLRPTELLGPDAELNRTQRRAAELLTYMPALKNQVNSFMAAIAALHERLEPAPLRPIHGSPHPQQWLMDGPKLGLVDFDRLSLGDPELDVATFVGEVDFERGDHSAVCLAFEDGYRSRYGDLDPDRLAVYRAHKRFAKVHRTSRSLKIDAADRVVSHLDRAMAALSPVGAA